jgi:hypothetical protein
VKQLRYEMEFRHLSTLLWALLGLDLPGVDDDD